MQDRVIEKLSHERVGAQINLIFKEEHPIKILTLLQAWDVLSGVWPSQQLSPAWTEAMARAQTAWSILRAQVPHVPAQTSVLWCQLACCMPYEARVANVRWLSDAKDRDNWLSGPERLRSLQEAFVANKPSLVNRMLAKLNVAECCCAYSQSDLLAEQEHVLWWLKTGSAIRSKVNGDTLKKLGFAEGPLFKDALLAALDAARAGADASVQLQVACQILKKTNVSL